MRFLETVLAEKKGIRVNALAKELGVESKAILEKLRAEGLGDAAPNHMSVVSLGLAESIREWFSGAGGVATAVETAPAVKVKKVRAPARKKAREAEGEGNDGSAGGTAVAEAPESAEHDEQDEVLEHGEAEAGEAEAATVAADHADAQAD